MKYTNNKNLSPLMAGMIETSMRRYSSGDSDYSTTTLIDAPRVVNLKRKHEDEIEVDVSDLIAAFVGNAMHEHLEGLSSLDNIVEKRLFAYIDGVVISGCLDILEFNSLLYNKVELFQYYKVGDYKTIKSWAISFGDVYEKWEQQLNINAWLATKNGFKIEDTAFIEYFIMDWQSGRAATDSSYPQSQQGRWEVKLWSEEEQLNFIKERIALHEAAKAELPLCSDKERWKRPDTHKLKKKGRKTSLKNEENLDDLIEWGTKKGYIRNGKPTHPYYFEFIKGDYIRCMKYCNASRWCEQYKGENTNG